jgi:hypothetical protein
VTEPTPDYTASAGRVVFPRSASVLNDTTICPACFTALRSTVCGECGLDLTHPAATELAAVSSSTAACLDRRVELIGQIRLETAQARARVVAPTPASAPPAATAPAIPSPVSLPQPSSTPAPASASASPTLAPPAQTPPPFPTSATSDAPVRPPRSSVQILLLVTGVALLSAYGIYAVATGQLGVVALSIVMAAVTAGTYVLASVLRRRGLRSTAEGIAVLAVVLTYLCALAARANNLLGFEHSTTTVFWGWTLFLTSAIFVVWSRFSQLRSPGLIGITLFSVGAGLLAGGIPTGLETTTRVFVGLLTVLLVGLTHSVVERVLLRGTTGVTRVPERLLAIAPGAVAGVFAFFTAFLVGGNSTVGPLCALLSLGVVALLHVVVALRQARAQTPSTWFLSVVIAASAAAGAAISFASTGFALAIRIDSFHVSQFWPAVLATVVLLTADTLHRRASQSAPKTPVASTTRAAVWAAAATTLLSVVLPAGAAFSLVANATYRGAWALADALPGAGTPVAAQEYSFATVGAFVVLTALAAGVWTITRAGSARRIAVGWMTGATAISAVPLCESPSLMSIGWFTIAAASVVIFLVRATRPTTTFAVRVLALSTLLVATTLGFLAAWSSPSAWWWGSLVTIALLVVGRRITAPTHGAVRAGLLGAAMLVALTAVGSVGRQLGPDASISPFESLDWLRFTGTFAIIVLAVSAAVRSPRFAPADRRTLFWISIAFAALCGLIPVFGRIAVGGAAILPEPVTGLLLALALIVGLLLWVGSRSTATLLPERLAASVALAPAVSWAVFQFARLLQLPTSADVLTPVTAGLLVRAGALALSTRRTSTIPRWAREAGIALVAAPVVLIAVASPGEYTWLVLLLAAITTLLLAVSADGLLASTSPRRHLGWLALALATGGLWWRLAESDVTGLEPYVLPLAGVLLLLAFLLTRAKRAPRSETATTVGAAPYIALAGLLVAILPLAAVASSGPIIRALVVGLVSAALLFLGTLTTGTVARRPYLDVAAVAGVVGVLVVSLGRASVITAQSGGTSGPALDAWLGSGFIVLVIAAFGLTRARTDVSAHVRSIAAQSLGAVALTALLVLEVANFAATDLGVLRALAVILLFCATHVIAFAVTTAPLTVPIGWLSLAYAVVAAGAGLVLANVDPLEIATIPVALALIATGVIHLERTPSARSWSALGPGTLVLLVPSLLATVVDQPLWRLVALGVIAIVVMIIGAVRRLQAPFVIGAVVTLVHVLATFSDEIRAVYESAHWLLWAAIGGVLLIVLAARYEQRVQNLKTIVLRVTALR